MLIFKKVAKAGKYQDDYVIHNLIDYITRPEINTEPDDWWLRGRPRPYC